VLETPLFRVRNKEKTIYCYSETERDNAVKELGGQPLTPSLSPSDGERVAKPGEGQLKRRIEITRFKGLGEISPKEFAQFIGKEMRLSKVEYAPRTESGPIFKNTPERLHY
jgi:DNA gyrase/topoisomerase IV subunit B